MHYYTYYLDKVFISLFTVLFIVVYYCATTLHGASMNPVSPVNVIHTNHWLLLLPLRYSSPQGNKALIHWTHNQWTMHLQHHSKYQVCQIHCSRCLFSFWIQCCKYPFSFWVQCCRYPFSFWIQCCNCLRRLPTNTHSIHSTRMWSNISALPMVYGP